MAAAGGRAHSQTPLAPPQQAAGAVDAAAKDLKALPQLQKAAEEAKAKASVQVADAAAAAAATPTAAANAGAARTKAGQQDDNWDRVSCGIWVASHRVSCLSFC